MCAVAILTNFNEVMMVTYRQWVVGMALMASALTAQAGTLRCGSKLVTEGEPTATLLSKCGQPALVEPITRSAQSATGELTQISAGERWTYQMGSGKFMQIVTINNGVIVSIENGPRQ